YVNGAGTLSLTIASTLLRQWKIYQWRDFGTIVSKPRLKFIEKSAAGPVSRILSAGKLPLAGTTYRRTAIPLGRALLCGSSDLPEGADAPSRHALAVAAD